MTDRTGSDESGRGVQKVEGRIPTSLSLGSKTTMDLSGLPEKERKTLLMEHLRGMSEISRKEQELYAEVGVLDATLHTLAGQTRRMSEQGDSITMTHTQNTSIGRTEVMIGNTERAKSGKLSKSQTGEKDWTPIYVIGGLIAAVLIAAAVVG